MIEVISYTKAGQTLQDVVDAAANPLFKKVKFTNGDPDFVEVIPTVRVTVSNELKNKLEGRTEIKNLAGILTHLLGPN
jgi:hypothetical protein